MSEEVKKKYQVVPNVARVIILQSKREQTSSGILTPGSVVAGENLHWGRIFHPGATKFHKGQIVYYSEYSSSRIYDMGAVERGEMGDSEVRDDKMGMYVVVAEDDIMAYEEEVIDDSVKVSVPAEQGQSKTTG